MVTRVHIPLPAGLDPVGVLGPADQALRILHGRFPGVEIYFDGQVITVDGPTGDGQVVATLLQELVESAEAGAPVDMATLRRAAGMLNAPSVPSHPRNVNRPTSGPVSLPGRNVKARSAGQQKYLDALRETQVVFGIGPAGTGKTYLAMAKAVEALLSGEVRRLVLTRPAVEAGENLGYLPGTLADKIDPYLRPLYDALHDLLDDGALPELMEAGAVEVAPLAYMRGRTLNDAFVVLDEAQNTTPSQMKMALTRLGHGSRLAVTGDVTQVDLPRGTTSGLHQAEEVLRDVQGVQFVYLNSQDVVRTRLVADIVDAYDDWNVRHAEPARSAGNSGNQSRSNRNRVGGTGEY